MFNFFHAITAKVGTLILSVALFFGATTTSPAAMSLSETSTSTPQEIVADEQIMRTPPSQKNILSDSKTTEQSAQTIPPHVPVVDLPQTQPDLQQDNHRMCSDEYGRYATWDETRNSCACIAGYDASADGESCVKIQKVEQPDLSINNSACDVAVANLLKFQKVSAGLMTPSGGTSVVAQGNAANYTKQYNAELPTYHLVVEAACKIPASYRACQASIQKFNTILAKNHLGEGNAGFAYLQFPAYQTEIYYACQ